MSPEAVLHPAANIPLRSTSYHHGKDDGSPGHLDDPEQDKTGQLDQGEEMNLPQGHVPQVDEIWLVFRRHPEQLQAIEELQNNREKLPPWGCRMVLAWLKSVGIFRALSCNEEALIPPPSSWELHPFSLSSVCKPACPPAELSTKLQLFLIIL